MIRKLKSGEYRLYPESLIHAPAAAAISELFVPVPQQRSTNALCSSSNVSIEGSKSPAPAVADLPRAELVAGNGLNQSC